MKELNIGDVVQLKSGGPKMTIHKIVGGNIENELFATVFKGADKGDIECKWFENGRIESAYFKPQMLVLAEENL